MKKVLSFILSIAMVCVLLPMTVFAADEHCNDEGCIVCELAEMINELPAADEIDESNAAWVIDKIHAIDRKKGELEEDDYNALLKLVDTTDNGSLNGYDVPNLYVEAVEAIRKFGGNSILITKSFVCADGSEVDVTDAEIQILVTRVDDTDFAPLTLTMSAMAGNDSSALYADSDFYNENADGDGWSYTYILPAGTYRIEEIADFGATVNGVDFVTTSISYNGVVSDNGITVTLGGNENSAVTGVLAITNREDDEEPEEPEEVKDPFGVNVFFVLLKLKTTDRIIDASASEGGSITPEGETEVKCGEDITYTITPDEGYAIADVLVDGESVGAVDEYTIENVKRDHEIAAIFEKLPPEASSQNEQAE